MLKDIITELPNFTDGELQLLRQAIRDLDAARAQDKLQRGDFIPLIESEIQLIQESKQVEACKEYSQRTGCGSITFAYQVVQHWIKLNLNSKF